MKEIKNEDRAYFAGLLDGEGTIVISKSKNTKNYSIAYGLRVQFGLTYKKILLEMQKFFGGNIYEEDLKKKMNRDSVKLLAVAGASPEKWKQSYNYHLAGRDALYFLKVVEPFCREKKGQASLGIRYEEGKRSFAGSYGRSKSETERCEFFYRELQRMKQEQSGENETEIDFEDDQQKLFSFIEEK